MAKQMLGKNMGQEIKDVEIEIELTREDLEHLLYYGEFDWEYESKCGTTNVQVKLSKQDEEN